MIPLLDMLRHRWRSRYNRLANPNQAHRQQRKASIITLLAKLAMVCLLGVLIFFTVFQLQLNIRVYLRNWVSQANDAYYTPLAGCFDRFPDTSPYKSTGQTNLSYELNPGVGLVDGFSCYDFAATIQPRPGATPSQSSAIYHAYWRSDLAPLGPKQLATLRSFFATQANSSAVYLWSNGDLSNSSVVTDIQSHVGDRLRTRVYDPKTLSKDTPIEDSPHISFQDASGYLDGDLIRLLVIYKYGGMWFDMDSLFVRDISPLLQQEWVLQWDCFLPSDFPFNGAFMHFNQQSPYLCEMLSEMANGPPPRPNTIDWGGFLYYRVFRRLLHNGIRPFSVLPWCFMDSLTCTTKNSMPNAFDDTGVPVDRLLQTFAFHWHNQWKKTPGSLFQFLESRHKNVTGW